MFDGDDCYSWRTSFGWKNAIKFPFNIKFYISVSDVFSLKAQYRLLLQTKGKHTGESSSSNSVNKMETAGYQQSKDSKLQLDTRGVYIII